MAEHGQPCFSLKPFLLEQFDEEYRADGFFGTNVDEFAIWKKTVRKKLAETIGLHKIKTPEPNRQWVKTEHFEGYTREKMILQTKKVDGGSTGMPVYILTPHHHKRRMAVIALHGHGSNGKEGLVYTGTEEMAADSALVQKIVHFNYTYALDLVQRGYTVFCPDLAGAGERREALQQGDEKIGLSSCNDLNNAAISLGLSLQGIIVHDILCLLDEISKEYEEIACCGFSGGGLSALWCAALDDRIKYTVVSGYFHGFRESILHNNLCGCNFVPQLWRMIDVCDLGSLVAPRPLLIECGSEVKLNGTSGLSNVYPQVQATKAVYDLFGSENFKHVVCDGGHQWYGTAYEFLAQF